MKQLYKGLVPLCIVLCVCLGLSAFALRTYWLYDRNDVEVINQLIEENNLDFSKNTPEDWNQFINWNHELPRRITTLHQPDYVHEKRSYDIVDFSKLTELKTLRWYVYKTNVLVLPENLEHLSCVDSGIEKIDVSRSEKLKTINCTRNNLKRLDLSKMTELEILECGENQLASLNLSNCKNLLWLFCEDNQLQQLILPEAAPMLSMINCQNNQLKKLDVTSLTSLMDLHCSNNQLETLEVKDLSSLEFISCNDNQLTELTAKNLPKLTHLYCQNNPLEELNIADVPSLEMLHCSDERGRIAFNGGIELISFDYPSRTVTVKAEPPAGKWLGGITGLPEGTEIIDNTATFQLTWSVVDLTPRYWPDGLK
ncbi:MAG: leucine-rich repeat domain-containing protein [Peptococcaceae bacterium]|nr:leucine-rich repeat domain-containing protein [Peptococcaceae bacterium]